MQKIYLAVLVEWESTDILGAFTTPCLAQPVADLFGGEVREVAVDEMRVPAQWQINNVAPLALIGV